MTREALGEFEQMVLLAILHLGDEVYGVPIVDRDRKDRQVYTSAGTRVLSWPKKGVRRADVDVMISNQRVGCEGSEDAQYK